MSITSKIKEDQVSLVSVGDTSTELESHASENEWDLVGVDVVPYTVKSGDTLSSIARRNGILDFMDLVYLNNECKNPLKVTYKWVHKDVFIQVGQTILIPKNVSQFNAIKNAIKSKQQAKELNQAVLQWNKKVLKQELNERIFPARPISVGMEKSLQGFLWSQQLELDSTLFTPRMVFGSKEMEEKATCSHLIKNCFAQSINPSDLKPQERAFLQTIGIDAWEFPRRAMRIWFEQKMSLMNNFQEWRITSSDPIISQEKYDDGLKRMGKYLETSWVPGSIMPIYYKFSWYKWQVAEDNAWKSEKHYNTHMSLFAGNNTISFPVSEVPDLKTGKAVPFESMTLEIQKQISNKNNAINNHKQKVDSLHTYLQKADILNTNPDLYKEYSKIDKEIEQMCLVKNDGSIVSNFSYHKMQVKHIVQTWNISYIQTQLSELLWLSFSQAQIQQLIKFQEKQDYIIRQIWFLSSNYQLGEYEYIDEKEYGKVVDGKLLKWYNDSIRKKLVLENERYSLQYKFHGADTFQDEQQSIQWRLKELDLLIQAEKEYAANQKKQIVQQLSMINEETLGLKLQQYIANITKNNQEIAYKIYTALEKRNIGALQNIWLSAEQQKNIWALQQTQEQQTDLTFELQHILWMKTPWYFPVDFSFLPESSRILQQVVVYNNQLVPLRHHQYGVNNLENLQNIQKSMSVVDFLLNFVQERADFSKSVYTSEYRKLFLNGIQKYSDLIHLKINGNNIDLVSELKKKPSEQTQVTPDDMFEITGPMMIDGLHMYNADAERVRKINARTRFFFEFAVSDKFLPTELLEPNETSSFRNLQLNDVAQHIRVKANYGLKQWETLEDKLKELIPIFEKQAFEWKKIGTPEYQALLHYYYGMQIKALQMTGYLENEKQLNPFARNVNRIIHYYDVKWIPWLYSKYIESTKENRVEAVQEKAQFRDFLDVQFFPWDTAKTIFSRIETYLEPYLWRLEYPNLDKISGLNDFLKMMFLQKFIQASIKSDKKLQDTQVLQNQFPSWVKCILHLRDVDRLLKEVYEYSSFTEYAGRLSPDDNKIIDILGLNGQQSSFIKSAMLVESYPNPRGTWMRLLGKWLIEKYPILEKIHDINSRWDLQVRFESLQSWKFSTWPSQQQLLETVQIFRRKDIVDFIHSYQIDHPESAEDIEKDKSILLRCEEILRKPNMGQQDFEQLYVLLQKLVRLDPSHIAGNTGVIWQTLLSVTWIDADKKGSTVIGKIFWASLLKYKLDDHSQKVLGFLQAGGENVSDILSDPKKRESYEKVVFLTNNLSESKVVYGLMESLLMRLIVDSNMLEKENAYVSMPELEVSASGQVQYWENTFIDHVDQMVNSLKHTQLWAKVQNGTLMPVSNRATPEQVHMYLMKKIQDFSEQVRSLRYVSNPQKYILELIYAFVWDTDLHEMLQKTSFNPVLPEDRLELSLLPREDEFIGNRFRNNFFHYVNKIQEFPIQHWK